MFSTMPYGQKVEIYTWLVTYQLPRQTCTCALTLIVNDINYQPCDILDHELIAGSYMKSAQLTVNMTVVLACPESFAALFRVFGRQRRPRRKSEWHACLKEASDASQHANMNALQGPRSWSFH